MATGNDFKYATLHLSDEQYAECKGKIKPETITEVECPHCHQWSSVKEWKMLEDAVYCELCGHHDGLKCPNCNNTFDYLMTVFNIKISTNGMDTTTGTDAV